MFVSTVLTELAAVCATLRYWNRFGNSLPRDVNIPGLAKMRDVLSCGCL